jgi:hypothetical protein
MKQSVEKESGRRGRGRENKKEKDKNTNHMLSCSIKSDKPRQSTLAY